MAINYDSLPSNKPVGSLLATGPCKLKIAKAGMKVSQNTGKEYLSLTYDAIDKEGKSGKIFAMLMDSDKELPRYQIKRFLDALHIQPTGDLELKDLAKIIIGKELIGDITVDEKSDRPRNTLEVFNGEIYYPISEWAVLTGGKAEISAKDALDAIVDSEEY